MSGGLGVNKEEIRSRREKFEREEKKRILLLQSKCEHLRIGHYDGFESFGTYNPQRVCFDCGYVETGGWWCYSLDCPHWHEKDSNKKVLAGKKGRSIVKIQSHEVHQNSL